MINLLENNENKLDDFINNYPKNIPLILYGCGGGIMDLPKLFKDNGINIVAICDKDKEKQGTFYCDIPVMSFESAMQEFNNFYVYIAVSNYFEEIKQYLQKYISSNRIFAFGRKKNMTKNEYITFLNKNKAELENIYNNLSDNLSKDTMINVIKGTATNDLSYFQNIYCNNQYFTNDIMNLSNNEVFVDVGSFNGDTITKFIQEVNNKFNKIYGFEPDENSVNKIYELKNKSILADKIEIIQAGAYSKTTIIGFNNDVSKGSHVEESNTKKIRVVSLDDYLHDAVTFIKMDIEGCELEALRGATNIIKKYKPKLAICIYHKQEDILEIPQFIMKLGLNYKYFMRHHTHSVDETVFYAI